MRLKPVLKDYIWGGDKLKSLFGKDNQNNKIAESWELSVHKDGVSVTDNGLLSDFISANPESVCPDCKHLPIMIKYIDARENLAVQVHPDDSYARLNEGDNGKTEMWYVISAEEGAGIYCGFKKDVTKEEFIQKVNENKVLELLNFIPVQAGDSYLIKPGTIHALGAGCVVCEVSQSSNVTYRVYDYDRVLPNGQKRELNVEKAMDVLNFSEFVCEKRQRRRVLVNNVTIRGLAGCKYFASSEIKMNGSFSMKNEDSFTAINVIVGSGEINGEAFKAGDTFFIPCGDEYSIKGTATLILTTRGK